MTFLTVLWIDEMATETGTISGSTAVTIVDSPTPSVERQVMALFCNRDTVDHTLTIQLTDGSSTTIIYENTIYQGETLAWSIGTALAIDDPSFTIEALLEGAVSVNNVTFIARWKDVEPIP